MIVNFRFGGETSSFDLSNNSSIVILDETVKSITNDLSKFDLIKWLINIALRTLSDKDLKVIERDFKVFAMSQFNGLSNFTFSNFVDNSFDEYKQILINKLRGVFKKAGINLKDLPEDNFIIFFRRILESLNSGVSHRSAVLSSYAMLPKLIVSKKLLVNPFAYQFDGAPLKCFFLKRGFKWHSVFLFKFNSVDFFIEIVHSKPVNIDFSSAWLVIYDKVMKKSNYLTNIVFQKELRGIVKFSLMKSVFINSIINNSKEIKLSGVIDFSKVRSYLKDYVVLESSSFILKKFNGLFLLRNDLISNKMIVVPFLNDKLNVLFVRNNKIISVESYDKAPAGDFSLIINESYVKKLSEKYSWFEDKSNIILKFDKGFLKNNYGSYAFSKINCDLLKDNEFIVTHITDSNGDIIIRNPVSETDFYSVSNQLKFFNGFKQSFVKLLSFKNTYFLIGDDLIRV